MIENPLAHLFDAARLRRGKIVERRPGEARVLFEDHDKMVSHWLKITSALSTQDCAQATYPLGTPVECLTDERGEAGVVLGATYSKENPAPLDNLDQILYRLAGGLEIMIDRAGPKVRLSLKATVIEIDSDGLAIASPKITFKHAKSG